MQLISRCRSFSILRNSINFSSTQFASFHSTPICNEKSKKKSNSDFKRPQQPTKNHIRIATRQKRADAKKALNSLLFNCTAFREGEHLRKVHGTSSSNTEAGSNSHSSTKKGRPKSNPRRAEKIHNHEMRRKYRKGFPSDEDDDHPEPPFHATFGNRWYTWSFASWTESSQTHGFDWRETFHGPKNGQRKWKTASELDSDDESCDVGSRSDRILLGLPPTGPLKMEDVKNAFHMSALKWHPDKHQGPSQAAAAEKFKLCVNAYKSLCSAVSTA